jgi:glycosyltransferase involved in cell wall biosynthesis
MRVTYIAAGAAGMFCGACARDATLARALAPLGCDVQFVPLYTPLRVDGEPPQGTTRTFFGGLSVYLQQRYPFFRRPHRLIDAVLNSRALLKLVSKFAVKTEAEALGPLTVSMLLGEDGRQKKELEALFGFLESGPRPNVVTITNTMLSGIAPVVTERLGVPVVCSIQGEDDFINDMPEPHRTRARDLIRANVKDVAAFISPSAAYADKMAPFLDVPRELIHVIPTGLDVSRYPEAPARSADPFTVGYLSRLTPGKGLDLLVEAVRVLVGGHTNAQLKVAGQLLDKTFERKIWASAKLAGLASRFWHVDCPDLPGKVAFLSGCNAVSVPSRAEEVHGTAVMEALALGIPVVAPDSGVFPEVLAKTGGGVLFPTGDVAKLAEALAGLAADPERAEKLGLEGREGIRVHYSAAGMAERTYGLYTGLC